MNLTTIKKFAPARKTKKRIGRGNGSGYGKTAGRGNKGAKSRSGFGGRRPFEGGQMPLFRRIPKRGFTNKFSKNYSLVNVEQLERFDNGTEVTVDVLKSSGLVKKILDGVKVLGNGNLTKSLTVKASKFSKSAKEKIEKAGGKIEVV